MLFRSCFDNVWKQYGLSENSHRQIVISGIEIDQAETETIYSELNLNLDDFNIVMMHGQENSGIDLRRLKNRGIDYLALGHIHSYKEANLDNRAKYCYPGCLEGRGFDECGEHGFVLLDIDESTFTYETMFMPFASRLLYEVETDISECVTSPQIINKVRETLIHKGYIERSLIKVILTGEIAVDIEKNISMIETDLKRDFYFLKVIDNAKYKINYMDYEKDQSLKGEYIRLIMEDSSLDEVDKATIIRYGIQALTGKEME